MGRLLLLLFIIVPALELWAIIEVGQRIGGWQTFTLIVITGIAGGYLAKREAAKIWSDAQRQLSVGHMPGEAIMDGLCVLIGGIMLLAPGFLSDIVGIVLVFPITRPVFRHMLTVWIRKKLSEGQTVFFFRR